MDQFTKLGDLKEGDEVIIYSGGWSNRGSIAVVQKVYKQHLIVEGTKYRKDTGFPAGDRGRWSSAHIAPAHPDAVAKIKRDRLLKELKGFDQWQHATDAEIATVLPVCRAISARLEKDGD